MCTYVFADKDDKSFEAAIRQLEHCSSLSADSAAFLLAYMRNELPAPPQGSFSEKAKLVMQCTVVAIT